MVDIIGIPVAEQIDIEDSMNLYQATEVESALAEVMDKVTPVTYIADSIETVTGTVTTTEPPPFVENIQTLNDGSYDVTEVTGSPGFDIRITYTGIVVGHEPNRIQLHIAYDGSVGHIVDLELWNYTGTPQFDVISADFVEESGTNFIFYDIDIPGQITDYVSGGEAILRFNHTSAGNINHDIMIDFAALKDAGAGVGGITEHGALSGLSDDDHLLYLLHDGTRPMTGTLDMGGNNLTNGGLGTFDSLNVESKLIQFDSNDFIKTIGSTSIAVGFLTGTSGTSGTFIGGEAGKENSGNQVTALGYRAASGNTATSVVGIGFEAGLSNTGTSIVAIGNSAGHVNSGDNSVFIGDSAGKDNNVSRITAVGRSAGITNTGERSSFFGYFAGLQNSGIRSTGIGAFSADQNTGDNVTGLGYAAGFQNTGNDSVFIGNFAGSGNSDDNVFILKQTTVNDAPLIFGNFTSGNVGIGTTDLSAKLNVGGDIKATGLGTFGSLVVNTDTLVVNASGFEGNVGIGTDSPDAKLEILQSADDNGLLISGFDDMSAENMQLHIRPDGKTRLITTNEFTFDVGTNDALKFNVNKILFRDDGLNTRVFMDLGAGKVGIGTDSPDAPLHISHASANQDYLTLDRGGGKLQFELTNVAYSIIAENKPLELRTETTTDISFAPNSVRAMTIINGGNVGIGVTDPGQKFVIGSNDGSDRIEIYHDNSDAFIKWDDGFLRFQTNEGDNTNSNVGIFGKGTGHGNLLVFDQDTANSMVFSAIGTTGRIGFSSPMTSLYIDPDASLNDVRFFNFASEGETKELKIFGFREGDALRTLEIGVGVDADDTASFDGVSNYYFDGNLDVNGALTIRELSADPSDPDEGSYVTWMSDGNGSGDDGDILIKITAGGSTKTTTLVDFSAI